MTGYLKVDILDENNNVIEHREGKNTIAINYATVISLAMANISFINSLLLGSGSNITNPENMISLEEEKYRIPIDLSKSSSVDGKINVNLITEDSYNIKEIREFGLATEINDKTILFNYKAFEKPLSGSGKISLSWVIQL